MGFKKGHQDTGLFVFVIWPKNSSNLSARSVLGIIRRMDRSCRVATLVAPGWLSPGVDPAGVLFSTFWQSPYGTYRGSRV